MIKNCFKKEQSKPEKSLSSYVNHSKKREKDRKEKRSDVHPILPETDVNIFLKKSFMECE